MPSMVENSTHFPSDIYSRMQQRIKKFYYIVILNLIVGAWYFYWRIAYSLNVHALWLSIPLLLAEIYIYIRITIFLVELWQPNWQLSKVFEQKNQKIRVRRSQLVNRLKQIDNIAIEVSQGEQFLNSFQIQVQTEPEDLIKVLVWFEELKQSFIPTRTWLECQTVLGEAFDNVVGHAHKKMPKETPIQLKVEIFNHSMIIKIWDYGPGFDLEKYCQYKGEKLVDRYAENGRGIEIITKVADYFSYTRQVDERNCLLIVKSFLPKTEQQTQNHSNFLGYLYSFYQLVLLSNPQYNQIRDYLDKEKKNIEYEIEQKEIEAQKIFYFSRFFNPPIINALSYLVAFIFFISPLIYFYTKTLPLQSYNSEFSRHFIPALLLNSLTFLVISWDINTQNKWYEQLYAICYSILGNQTLYSLAMQSETNFKKYEQKNQFIAYIYWAGLLLYIITLISIAWGSYQPIDQNLEQYSCYFISILWSTVNLLFLSLIVKINLSKSICQNQYKGKDDILKYQN